jgi:hypothetical protein
METLLKLMILGAFPSVTGVGTYIICREIKRPLESFIQFVVTAGILLLPMAWVVATTFDGPLDLGFAYADVSGPTYLLFLLLVVGTLWFCGGHADAKVAGPVDPGWLSSHFLLYSAMMTALIVGSINVLIVSVILGNFLPFLRQPSSWMVYTLLLSISPALTPLSIQFKHWLKLQPGFRKI